MKLSSKDILTYLILAAANAGGCWAMLWMTNYHWCWKLLAGIGTVAYSFAAVYFYKKLKERFNL